MNLCNSPGITIDTALGFRPLGTSSGCICPFNPTHLYVHFVQVFLK